MRVLVVDDEPAVREVLERILRVEGFDVALAQDGREAVRAQAAAPADAVLLDVLMPGLDGLEVCRRMRDVGDRTPVLMLTARHATRDRVTGLDAGADDYLPKPFALEELLARLRALARRFTAVTAAAGVLRFADLEVDTGTRDRVTGLDAGADDYLPKPFALEELLARLRALLRRSSARSRASSSSSANGLGR